MNIGGARILIVLAVVGLGLVGCSTSAGREFNERGIAYGRRGEHERALESFGKAIELDPTVSDYYMNRGLAYYLLGQNQRAIADLDQAIRLDPNNVLGYMNRGSVYDDSGEPGRALEDLGQAIRLRPSEPGPYRNRGVTRVRLGEYPAALADLDRAIALDPSYPAAYLTRACVHALMDRMDRAGADYAKARQLASGTVPELASGASVSELACRRLGGVPRAIDTTGATDDLKSAGYGNATWEMTAEQVLKAEAPRARKVEPPEPSGDLTRAVAIDEVQLGTDRFRVEFFFDSNLRLQQVTLRPVERATVPGHARMFARLEKLLSDKYGGPAHREGGQSPRILWDLPNTTIRLEHFTALGGRLSLLGLFFTPSKASRQ